MKRSMNLLCAFILLLGLSGVASAYTLDYTYNTSGNEFISPFDATTNNFDSGVPSWTWMEAEL